MLPEVQTFLDELQAADNAYAEKRGEIHDKFGADREKYKALRDTLDAARQAAWDHLQNGEGNDKLASYIAEHHRDQWGHVVPLLKQLPLSREDLDEYVDDKDCDEWNAAYVAAVQAGVLPDSGAPVSPARRTLNQFVRKNVQSYHRGELKTLINAVVAEEKAADGANTPADAVSG